MPTKANCRGGVRLRLKVRLSKAAEDAHRFSEGEHGEVELNNTLGTIGNHRGTYRRSSLPHTGSSRSTRHVQPMVEVEHGEVELNNAPSYAFFSFHPRHLEPMVEVLEHADVEVHGEIMRR